MVNVESRRAAGPAIVAVLPIVVATLGLAGACWAATAWLMNGMDIGVATQPGAFGFFTAAWVTMMAAMMLPGAAPAFARHARRTARWRPAWW
jgi:predicted metal-binding membrane protein